MFELDPKDLINHFLSDDSLLNVFDLIPILQLFKLRLVCKRFKQLVDYKLKTRTCIAITIKSDDDNEDIGEEYESRLDCFDGRHRLTANDCIYRCCRLIDEDSTTLYLLSERQLQQLFAFCPNVRTLSLEFALFDQSVWRYFRDNCPKEIQHLDLSHTQGLVDEVIRFFAISCGPTLQHILLNDSDISETNLKFLLENCPKLEILDVSKNVRISGQSFGLLSKTIRSLSLNQCLNVGFEAIDSLISGSAKCLQRLEINGEFVEKKMLEQICDHLKCLTHFEIDCSNVKDKRVIQKISNLRLLEELVIYLPPIKFDDIFIDIMRNCPKLKKISIDSAIVTDYSIKYLPQFCPNLTSLSVSSGEVVINKKISDDSCEPLSRLKNLKELDLQYTRIGDKLLEIITNCPNISVIEIDGSKRVTNDLIESVIAIANQRPNQSLTLFARETKLTQPLTELPNNFELIIN